MQELDFDAGRLNSGWGSSDALDRMTAQIGAFNTRLLAEGGQCAHRKLIAIQEAVNQLGSIIARMQRLVDERITVLRAGARDGG